jgi:hypothetical protein
MIVRFAMAALLAFAPVAAFAQDSAAPAEAVTTADPVRTAAAERVAARLWPDGTWQRQMDGMMDGFFSTIMGSLGDTTSGMAETMFGKDSKEARQAANPRAAAAGNPAADPANMDRMMQAVVRAMAPIMTEIEPQIRAGIAASAARRFTTAQLVELETFFATETGAAFASQSMMMLTDPEVMQASIAMMPRLMEEMPRIMEEVSEETGLPVPGSTAGNAAAQAAAQAAADAAYKVE